MSEINTVSEIKVVLRGPVNGAVLLSWIEKMKFKSRGRHLEIPIIEYHFSELRLATDRFVELRFRDKIGNECSLQLADSLTMTRGRQELTFDGSRPGTTFAPQTLAPLAENLGCTVQDALAQENGTLRIELSSKVHFTVTPQTGYEGWHLRLRPNGESWTGHLHGAIGHLIG